MDVFFRSLLGSSKTDSDSTVLTHHVILTAGVDEDLQDGKGNKDFLVRWNSSPKGVGAHRVSGLLDCWTPFHMCVFVKTS